MSKILIVEDEVAIAELEKDYLELSGFEVEVAADGQVGLKKALTEDYDLIILDLMLPEVDGLTVCQKIREFSGIPIVTLETVGNRCVAIGTGKALDSLDKLSANHLNKKNQLF